MPSSRKPSASSDTQVRRGVFGSVCALLLPMVVLLMSLSAGTSAARTQEVNHGPEVPTTLVPVERLLRPDGTLDLRSGYRGAIDTRGWNLLPARGGAPRFGRVSSSTSPASSSIPSASVEGLLSPSFSQGPPWDGIWDKQFYGETNGRVMVLLADGAGNIYAGGEFTRIGGVSARYIAKWNGSEWLPVGTALFGGPVFALAFDASGNLYAGGNFSSVGGVTARGVAKWDGSTWSGLGVGTGFTSNGGAVQALAFDAAGNLYAGGNFLANVNGPRAIARWNGTSWSALGTGMNGSEAVPVVKALAFDATGRLLVGGQFTVAGGVAVNGLAAWDGTTWSALGERSPSARIESIAVTSGGDILVAGVFSINQSGTFINNLARFSGGAWSALSGFEVVSGNISRLSLDAAGDLYVFGVFDAINGVPINGIAKWNGTTVSPLGSGAPDIPTAMTLASSGQVFIAGYHQEGLFDGTGAHIKGQYFVEYWDGSPRAQWETITSGLSSNVNALLLDGAGNLYVGGDFRFAGGVAANHVAKWNGTRWSALGQGTNGPVHALALDDFGNIVAGGQFYIAGGVSALNIASWNGTAWSAMGPGLSGPVYALAKDNEGRIYIGGEFDYAGSWPAQGLAVYILGDFYGIYTGPGIYVKALAVIDENSLFVGGTEVPNGAGMVSHWDGVQWHLIGASDGDVRALALMPDGELLAGGAFSSMAGPSNSAIGADGIARWNGTTWTGMGPGPGSMVAALKLDGSGNVYAGGLTPLNPDGFDHIARWDGTSWSFIGSGPWSPVHAIALDGDRIALDAEFGKLFAGGAFRYAGNLPTNRIASFTAEYAIKASALAHGSISPSGRVRATRNGTSEFTITPAPGYRIASVWVDSVSVGQPSVYQFTNVTAPHTIEARFEIDVLGVDGDGDARMARLAPAMPNPFFASTALRFSLAQPGRIELTVFSVDGRRVRSLASGMHAAGDHQVEWDGRDDAGRLVREGVYYARLVTPQLKQTRVVTFLK